MSRTATCARWLAHDAALATSVSIEQHLVSCDGCVDRVGVLARDDSALDAVLQRGWERVRDAVTAAPTVVAGTRVDHGGAAARTRRSSWRRRAHSAARC